MSFKNRYNSTVSTLCVLGTVTAFTLAGCHAPEPTQQAAPREKLIIATSSYPLSYLVENIGGSLVELKELPTASDTTDSTYISYSDLADADLIFYLRGQYTRLDSLLTDRETQAIDLSHTVDVLPRDKSGLPPIHNRLDDDDDMRDDDDLHDDDDRHETDDDLHETDDDRHETDDDQNDLDDLHETDNDDLHDDDLHGNDPGDDAFIYDPTKADPNFWSDPDRMIAASQKITEVLSLHDPSRAKEFHANADILEDKLEALEKKYGKVLRNKCETASFAVTQDSFGYLAYEYGLKQVVVKELDPSKTPSESDLTRAKILLEQERITTVFAPIAATPKASRALADATGAQYSILEEPTSSRRDSHDYLSIMQQNLISLATSMRCAK